MNKRMLVIGLGALALIVVIAVSAAGGAALAYSALNAVRPAAAAEPSAPDAEAGLLVAAVDPEGPAARAGLRRGDILLQLDGKAVDDLLALRQALRDLKPGDEVALAVRRGDEPLTLTAALGGRDGQAYLGLTPCGALPAGNVIAFVDAFQGALITEVVPDGPAAQAGLQVGDRVTSADGQDLTPERTLADVVAAHQPGDTLTLRVERPGAEAHEVMVTLGEHPDEPGRAYLGVRYRLLPDLPKIDVHGLPPDGVPAPELFFEPPPFDEHFHFDLPEGLTEGAVIGRVVEDGPAAQAGLQPGDVITAVDGAPLKGPRALAEVVAAHKPGDTLSLSLRRTGEDQPITVEVTLGEDLDSAGQAYLGVSGLGYFRVEKWVDGAPPGDIPFRLPDWPDIFEPGGDA